MLVLKFKSMRLLTAYIPSTRTSFNIVESGCISMKLKRLRNAVSIIAIERSALFIVPIM